MPSASDLDRTPASPVRPMPAGNGSILTPRQTEVLHRLMQRKPNKLICRDLHLSEGTVKGYVSSILKALKVRTCSEAVAEAVRRGWI